MAWLEIPCCYTKEQKSQKRQNSVAAFATKTLATAFLHVPNRGASKGTLTVVSPIVKELLHVQVDDVCAHVIQETLVVGDNKKGFLPGLEVAVTERRARRVTIKTRESQE